MQKEDLVRILVKGGIISPGDFLQVIQKASELGTSYIHLGSRQDILFPLRNKKQGPMGAAFEAINIQYDMGGREFQNILSSYAALDVMPTTHWLASHTYHHILDTFDYQPKLKINLADPIQSLVPLFTGNINFVASSHDNYWFLFLRFSELESRPWCAPDLIYGYDLAKIAKVIEEIDPVNSGLNYLEIYQKAKEICKPNGQKKGQELVFPEATSPYYEGMNRIVGGKYWLGLYWRNNKFSISFLKALCQLCLDTDVGKISLTPWKSIIVKGIAEKDRLSWEKLLGKYGINIRHSSLELNWHLPVLDEEALEIKNYLVRALDKQDISTYGLSFSVKTGHMALFTSVAIEKALREKPGDPETFNILYSKDFNPNLSEYFYYAKNVSKETLPSLLIELSHKYYDQLEGGKSSETPDTGKETIQRRNLKYQCSNCLTVYDERYGDVTSGIAPGTSFMKLSNDYCCQVCESPKSAFKLIETT